MKILPPLIALLAIISLVIAAATSSSSSSSHPFVSAGTVGIDDVKCQVCDVAAAHYTRTLLHAHLYCMNLAHRNTTDGTTPSKLSYLVQVLEPFALEGINANYCADHAPAKKSPGVNAAVGVNAAAAAPAPPQKKKEEPAAAEKAMKQEIDEVLVDDDDFDGSSNDGASPKGTAFSVDPITASEMARKNSLCERFLDSFPAIQIFPGNDKAAALDPDDPATYENENPDAIPPRFVELLHRACEAALVHKKKNSLLVTVAAGLVEKFPLEDAPRTVAGARNHIYQKAIKAVQETVCASNCPADMKRGKHFVAVAAYNVKRKPVIQ